MAYETPVTPPAPDTARATRYWDPVTESWRKGGHWRTQDLDVRGQGEFVNDIPLLPDGVTPTDNRHASSKSFVDAGVQEAKDHADDIEVNTRAYAEGQADEALTQANNFTNTRLGGDPSDTDAIGMLQNFANDRRDDAIAAAESYTDTEVDAAKTLLRSERDADFEQFDADVINSDAFTQQSTVWAEIIHQRNEAIAHADAEIATATTTLQDYADNAADNALEAANIYTDDALEDFEVGDVEASVGISIDDTMFARVLIRTAGTYEFSEHPLAMFEDEEEENGEFEDFYYDSLLEFFRAQPFEDLIDWLYWGVAEDYLTDESEQDPEDPSSFWDPDPDNPYFDEDGPNIPESVLIPNLFGVATAVASHTAYTLADRSGAFASERVYIDEAAERSLILASYNVRVDEPGVIAVGYGTTTYPETGNIKWKLYAETGNMVTEGYIAINGDVTDPEHATTKDYVDTEVSGVQGNLDTHIGNTGAVHGATSFPDTNQIILRDGSGRAQVVDPDAPADIATRGWVEGHVSNELGPYATEDWVTNTALDGYATETWVTGEINTATDDMATQTWVNTQLEAYVTDTELSTILDDYATEAYVDGEIDALNLGTISTQAADDVDITGGSIVVTAPALSDRKVRNIFITDTEPTNMEEGDVWIVPEE